MAEQPTREEAEVLYGQMTVVDLQAELGERNLPTSGLKPELVARLLDADFPPAPSPDAAADSTAADGAAPPPAEPPADENTPTPEDGELCAACWPGGWPTPDTNNASCEHGTWDR